MFRVESLGSSQVCRPDGSQVHFRSRKHFGLLVFLALTGPRLHRRERLVGLLWPEDGEARARHSLSQSLYALKRLLGDSVVEVRSEEVQIGAGRPTVDALEFEEHLRRNRLADAASLYRGEFLEGFWVRGARPFEEWMDRERARLSAEFRQALRTLIRDGRERGEWSVVMERSRRLIQLEPYDEQAYADLMRALWIVGDRAGALRQYGVLRDVLASELESEPGKEVQELAARIRRRTAEAKRKESERKAGPAFSEPPFIGRKEEYAQLVSVWERVKGGESAGVVLTGEPGIGKTRLAEEFLKYVATEDALVLRGGCYPFLRGIPYAPFVEALRPVLSAGRFIKSLEGRWALQLARVFPEFIGDLPSHDSPGDPRGGSAIRLQFEAVAQLFHTLCAERPTALLIDNLQWADSGSSSLAHFLLQRLSRHRVLVLITSRDQTARDWPTLPVDSERQMTLMTVPLLSADETGSLVSAVSAPVLPNQVYGLSGGNPFFCLELCKTAQPLRQSAESTQRLVDLNGLRGVDSVVDRRLSLLGNRERRVLEAASVMGDPVSLHLLEILSALQREDLLDVIERLVSGGFVLVRGEDLTFAHDLFQEAIYKSLPEMRRRLLHSRVASAFDAVWEGNEEIAAKQAWHYDRAGDRARAFRVAMSSARKAMERLAFEQAQLTGEIAVRNSEATEQRLESSHLVGEALVHQRRYSSARVFLQDAMSLTRKLGDYDRLVQIQNLIWRTELDSSDRPVGEILSGANATISAPWIGSVSSRSRMDVVVILLGAAYRAGDLEMLGRAADFAEQWAQRSEDARDLSTMLRARGMYEGFRGNLESSVGHMRHRLQLARDHGSVAEQLDALVDLSVVLTANFVPLNRCEEVHLEAIGLSDEVGDPLVRARCRNNWGATLIDWGHFAEAERQLEAAVGILKPHPDLADERASIEVNLGELYWLLCRPAKAASHWKLADQLAGSGARPVLWLNAAAGLGLCAMSANDEATAREYCFEAFRALRRCRGARAEYQDVYLLASWIDVSRGRLRRALSRLSRAADRLLRLDPAGHLRLLLGAARLLVEPVREEGIQFAQQLASLASLKGAPALEREALILLETARDKPPPTLAHTSRVTTTGHIGDLSKQ